MDLAQFSTEQLVNIIKNLVDEVALRAGIPIEEPDDPMTTVMRALSEPRGAPRTMAQRAPPAVRRMSNIDPRTPVPNGEMQPPAGVLQPGQVIATHRTDPQAAAVFAGRARTDGAGPINGNGVGMGGGVDIVP